MFNLPVLIAIFAEFLVGIEIIVKRNANFFLPQLLVIFLYSVLAHTAIYAY